MTQPTKSESRKSASSAKKQFNKINKNQSKSTAKAANRQNTNTGGVQSSVAAVAKAFSKGKSLKKIGKISNRKKKTGKMNVCKGGGKGRM